MLAPDAGAALCMLSLLTLATVNASQVPLVVLCLAARGPQNSLVDRFDGIVASLRVYSRLGMHVTYSTGEHTMLANARDLLSNLPFSSTHSLEVNDETLDLKSVLTYGTGLCCLQRSGCCRPY